MARTTSPQNHATSHDIFLPPPHPAQYEAEQNMKRFNLLRCGRRWGKDVSQMRRIIKIALSSRKPVAWYAPTYRMLQENWREISSYLEPVIQRSRESEHRLDLITGAPIDFWSLENPESSRGRKYYHVAINEAALVKDLRMLWNTVIRPTLADWAGSADFGSTPRGLNDFYELEVAGRNDPEWAIFHYPTDTNPHIPKEEIEALRRSLPARVVKQEIDAEYLEDGSFFENLDKMAILQTKDTPDQHINHVLGAGLDWGNEENFTCITIGCRTCKRIVYWEKFSMLGYMAQRERIFRILRHWNNPPVLPERNSIGLPNLEIMVAGGLHVMRGPDGNLGFNTSSVTKPVLIQKMALALQYEDLYIPAEYKDEFAVFELSFTSSGQPIFEAPRGFNDDEVMSVALCNWVLNEFVSWDGFTDLGKVEGYISQFATPPESNVDIVFSNYLEDERQGNSKWA